MKKNLMVLGILLIASLCFGKAETTKAGVVEPTRIDDERLIQKELDETGNVTLVKGGVYHLHDTIYLVNNMTVDAEGATIICDKPIAFNVPYKAGYKALTNVTINGGTWKCSDDSDGYGGSSFKFTHANNITLKNMKVRSANLSGHSFEFVACKNVLIENCDIAGVGKSESKTEEAVQLDVASAATAPYLSAIPFAADYADKLWNKAGCKNITIKNCKIVGNRGVVANHTKYDGDTINSIHENITLIGNDITGLNGEGVVLFNTKSATVKDNKIKSLRKGKNDSYTVGLHISTFSNDKDLKKAVFNIAGNTIYGGRQAVMVYSHSGVKFGKAVIEKNKLFCKAGKEVAIHAKEQSINKIIIKSNTIKTYKDK